MYKEDGDQLAFHTHIQTDDNSVVMSLRELSTGVMRTVVVAVETTSAGHVGLRPMYMVLDRPNDLHRFDPPPGMKLA